MHCYWVKSYLFSDFFKLNEIPILDKKRKEKLEPKSNPSPLIGIRNRFKVETRSETGKSFTKWLWPGIDL